MALPKVTSPKINIIGKMEPALRSRIKGQEDLIRGYADIYKIKSINLAQRENTVLINSRFGGFTTAAEADQETICDNIIDNIVTNGTRFNKIG